MKKKVSAAKKEPKKNALDLKSVLYALDTKNRKYYMSLTAEEQKQYSAFVLMRFMSSSPDQNGLHEYHVQMVNDVVNDHFWDLGKHPELCHLLLSMCGVGSKQYHPWIAGPKKIAQGLIFGLFQKQYPNMNEDEFNIIIKHHTKESIKSLCLDWGMADQDIKKYVEQFSKISESHVEVD